MKKLTMLLKEILQPRKRLNESSNIIQSEEFFKLIEAWVESPSETISNEILKYKSRIPTYFRKSNTLYRGINLTEEQWSKIKSGSKFIQKGVRSWTTEKTVAEKFISNQSLMMGSNSSKPIKLLVMKRIEPDNILLDIYQYYLFVSGASDFKFDDLVEDSIIKEREVLAYDITITKADIIKKY